MNVPLGNIVVYQSKKFDIENRLWKYDFGTFWQTDIHWYTIYNGFFEHVYFGQKFSKFKNRTPEIIANAH